MKRVVYSAVNRLIIVVYNLWKRWREATGTDRLVMVITCIMFLPFVFMAIGLVLTLLGWILT